MSRRAFACSTLTAALLSTVAGVAAAQEVSITFAIHTTPPGPEFDAVAHFAELVESRSDGAITVATFEGAVLGGERDNIEQLQVGEVAMTLNGDLLPSLLAPELAPTVVPFVFPSAEAVLDYWDGDMGQRLRDAILERGGIHVVGVMRRGDRHLTANVAAETPADVDGLKLRVPEIPTWVQAWSAVGAQPTPVAWPEVFSALQTGVVDAQENPCSNINQARLYEVQQYLIMTGHLPNMWHWALSDAFLQGVSDEHRQIIVEAAAEAAAYGDQITGERIAEVCGALEEAGMTVIQPDQAAFFEAARPAIEAIAENWADGVYEATLAYQQP